MDPRDRDLLVRNRVRLMDVQYDLISPALIQRGVIDHVTNEELMACPTNRSKIERFLGILPRRGPEAMRAFIDALRPDHGWLADSLVAETGPGNLPNGHQRPIETGSFKDMLLRKINSLKDLPVCGHLRKISKELEASPTLCKNWNNLAYGLDLRPSKVTDIRREMIIDGGGVGYALLQVLDHWVTLEGSEATFKNLVRILHEEEINDVAERLINIWAEIQ